MKNYYLGIEALVQEYLSKQIATTHTDGQQRTTSIRRSKPVNSRLRRIAHLALLVLLLIPILAACAGTGRAPWTRRDLPTDGLDYLVEYNLEGPGNDPESQKNYATLQGVNYAAPFTLVETRYSSMSGTKVQRVLMNGDSNLQAQALGMNKPSRFAGLSNFMQLEPATFAARDRAGNVFCGAKIRIKFARNLSQALNPELKDWDSLWYYDIPCRQDENGLDFVMDIEAGTLRSVVINQLFQFRMYGRSIIENWGHSVTVLGGPAAQLPAGWWMNWDTDVPDVMDAAEMANAMVNDLDAADNPMPWLEFMSTGQFAQSYLIYSAGDADRYNLPRLILNRQSEYVVAYRPDRASAWDWIRIAPSYNLEWNDVAAKLEEIHGLTFNGKLDKNGVPIDGSDQVLKEFERSGFANAPNPDLDQIVFYDSDGQLLYAMTVRAFVGANDSLIMFGARQPVYDRDSVALTDNITRPVNYGADGKPVPETDLERQARDEQWLEFQKEGSFWHFLKDNPSSVSADLFVQYRFRDNTSWAPIKCTDSDGNEYTCGYDPVEWKLLTTYYLDGKVRRPWLIMQLLGEVGVRSLGVSYASGRSEGTGILFAMGQLLLRDEYRDGMTQESIWRLDARASQLPATLAEAWREVHLAPGR